MEEQAFWASQVASIEHSYSESKSNSDTQRISIQATMYIQYLVCVWFVHCLQYLLPFPEIGVGCPSTPPNCMSEKRPEIGVAAWILERKANVLFSARVSHSSDGEEELQWSKDYALNSGIRMCGQLCEQQQGMEDVCVCAHSMLSVDESLFWSGRERIVITSCNSVVFRLE